MLELICVAVELDCGETDGGLDKREDSVFEASCVELEVDVLAAPSFVEDELALFT